MIKQRVSFHQHANLWIVIETDHASRRNRWSVGGWYNSTDAERAISDGSIEEWEEWTAMARPAAWCEPLGETCPTCRMPISKDDVAMIEVARDANEPCPRCLRPPEKKS